MHATNIEGILSAVLAIEKGDLIRALKAHGGRYEFVSQSSDAELQMGPVIQYTSKLNGPGLGDVLVAQIVDSIQGQQVMMTVTNMNYDNETVFDQDVTPGFLSRVTQEIPYPEYAKKCEKIQQDDTTYRCRVVKTTDLVFDGTTYRCRIVKSKDGQELTIAPLSLYDALHPRPFGTENDGFASEEAVRLDEEVFYYTDKNHLGLPDDELVAELKKANPEWFD